MRISILAVALSAIGAAAPWLISSPVAVAIWVLAVIVGIVAAHGIEMDERPTNLTTYLQRLDAEEKRRVTADAEDWWEP